ncbi:putative 4-coumarate--CoA ligase 2 isoform X1 [Rhipicephalus microplus]|uniref:putative 4-coumarate--CoA ligase 2 isoform X1 n=1 Tax=Rhipicephalus microplus TaxID=6941 RepID=UPI003F6C3060
MKARIEDGVVYSPYPEIDIPICSVYSAISKFLSMQPEKLAVVDEQISLTRGEFLARMKRYAAGFQAHGLGPDHRVAVHLGNSAENLTALFALTFTGASVILCNPILNHDELLFQMSDGGATHAFTSSQLALKMLAVSSKLHLKGLFVTGEADGFISVSQFPEQSEPDFCEVLVEYPKETTVALFYSSGTTGHAKGMEISHYSFVANLHMTRSVLTYEEKENDVLLAWYPLTYASGFLFTIVAACIGSTCVIVNPGISFDELVYYVNKYKVTTLASVPTRLHYYLSDIERTGTVFPSIRKLNVGGTVLTSSLADRLLAAFPGLRCLRNLYGMSESCSVLCAPPTDEISAANIGFPGPMVQLMVINLETGRKLGPHENGELYFRAPSVMRGYYKQTELTAAFMDKNGWCKTGDIVYYDESGRFYFVDRMKDMIKCLDQQVSSTELESLLQSHECVADAAVVAIPRTEYGDAPAAFVVLKNPTTASAETASELKAYVAKNTEAYKHLHGGLTFVERLPRNVNGKVMKQHLKQLYQTATVH